MLGIIGGTGLYQMEELQSIVIKLIGIQIQVNMKYKPFKLRHI